MRLKAAALYYSVVISMLIAIVTASIILLAFNYRNETDELYLQQQLQNNAQSGLNLLLVDNTIACDGSTKSIGLFDDSSGNVTISKQYWGLYHLQISKSVARNKSVTKAALCGPVKNDSTIALYLADHERALSLCGRTVIKGYCKLPSAGVKRAYIEGQSFVGADLINGKIKNSDKQLPALSKELMNWNKLQLQYTSAKDSQFIMKKGVFSDSLSASFSGNTLHVIANNPVEFGSSSYLQGNVIIHSSYAVKIDNGAEIKDILIYAPSIIIEDGFKGVMQLFATDSVIVGRKVELNYPSSIVLLATNEKKDSNKIMLADESKVFGSIVIEVDRNNGKRPVLIVNKDASVMGMVYVNGSVELKGKVKGSLYCNQFYLQTPSSIYENCLLNVEINGADLPSYFCNNTILPFDNPQGVIQWLQ